MLTARLKDAFITALIAAILALPLAGARTVDGIDGLVVEWHLTEVAIAAVLIFFGRLVLDYIQDGQGAWAAPLGLGPGFVSIYLPFPSRFLQVVAVAGSFVLAVRAAYVWGVARRAVQPPPANKSALTRLRELSGNLPLISWLMFLFALVMPFTPLASRYVLDVAVMVMTYIMLA